MKIAVWDTYVERSNGTIMHFDILVPENLREKDLIVGFGEKYLKTKPFETRITNWERCSFCHIEAPDPVVSREIEENGFSVIELSNCD